MTVNLKDHQLVNWDCSEDQYFDLCHVTNSVLQKMINTTQNTELQWGSCLSIQPSAYSSIFYSWSQSPFFSLPISIFPLIALLCLLKSSFAKYIRLRWWSGKMLRYWSVSSQIKWRNIVKNDIYEYFVKTIVFFSHCFSGQRCKTCFCSVWSTKIILWISWIWNIRVVKTKKLKIFFTNHNLI